MKLDAFWDKTNWTEKKSCSLLIPRGGLCNLIKRTIKLEETTFRCVVYPTKTYNAILIVNNKSGILLLYNLTHLKLPWS